MNRQLHHPASIFSGRHFPSWLVLTASAGMVNVIAILATEKFVTHLTGTASQLGMSYDALWLALDFLVVLVCFVVGAMTAAWLLDVRAEQGKRPLYSVPLFVTSSLIALVGIGGTAGWFGPFGGSIDQPGDFILLSGLSFAMGLQNGAVATSTGLVVRTTHITGPATDLGLHLAELIFVKGERVHARRNAALRGGKIASFILGSALAVPIATHLGYAAFFVPAAAVFLANISSFVLVDIRQLHEEAPQPAEPIETETPRRPVEQGA